MGHKFGGSVEKILKAEKETESQMPWTGKYKKLIKNITQVK